MVAAPAARNIQQDGVAFVQRALGRADGLHCGRGADTAGGAVQCGGTQAVFTEAGNTEHVLGCRLIVARDTHAAAVHDGGADLAAQACFADAFAQECRSKFLDDIAVQFAGFAHTVKLIRALDRAQTRSERRPSAWVQKADACSAWRAFAASWSLRQRRRSPEYPDRPP